MEKIISYDELPSSEGQSVYFRMETDPKLYLTLLSKGYRIIKHISQADDSTIYVTGRRQDYECKSYPEYKSKVDRMVEGSLNSSGIVKPNTVRFSYMDLLSYKYRLPFVLKNENQNGGREKFLINTEEDYNNLINACIFLVRKNFSNLNISSQNDLKCLIDYYSYLETNFLVQEYINTPSDYNTTLRVLTSSSNDLLYASLKYNKPNTYTDNTTLLGYLLSEVYPISTKSIVSNTLSGGENILLGENNYFDFEKELLNFHDINSETFHKLLKTSQKVHEKYRSELGILCGFDYIYNKERQKWFLLEYHSRPMVGDYCKRQGIYYHTKEDKLTAEGRVRATSLSLTLKRSR